MACVERSEKYSLHPPCEVRVSPISALLCSLGWLDQKDLDESPVSTCHLTVEVRVLLGSNSGHQVSVSSTLPAELSHLLRFLS